ncbi:hypothetical protein Tco_0426000 [Tanacetum coccineum]
MPRKTADDHKNTRSYIPKFSIEYNAPLKHIFEFFENRYIHEGRVVYQYFDDLVYVESMFKHIGFECLLKLNEQIVPHFILKFYSQYHVKCDLEGQMFVKFVIQNQLFSFTLEEFGQILGIPCEGQCYFSDKWSLDHLASSVPTGGPYQTNPPSPDEIKLYVQVEREDGVTRIHHDRVIDVKENQILTREITPIMKTWVDIIRENIFCLGGNRDHVPACLCHMLYCIARSEQYNLVFFIAKRMEFVTKQSRLILPYERKTRKDYGTKRGRSSTSTSSSSAFGQLSSSHHIDDDNDGNDEGTSRASTPSPTRFVNSLSNNIPQVFSNPPNIDPNIKVFYTRQTKILNRQVQLRDEHQSGLRSIGKGIKNLLRGKKK